MVRTNQGGSILGFLIVGGVLALLLVGGAYIVRHQLAPADTDTRVTQNSAGDSDDADNTNDKEVSQDQDEKVESDNDDKQPDEPTVLPGSTDDSDSEKKQDSPAATDLPQTGPADVLLSAVVMGGIVGLVTAYKRSRNTLISL